MITTPQNNAQSGRTGSGFTNLQRYLSANQGNQLGQVVGGGIANAAQGVRSGITGAANQFQQGADAGNLASDANQQARASVLQQISSGTNPQVTDDQAKQFATFRGGQYTGPRDLGDTSKLQNQAANAESLGRGTATASGRQGLLQDFVGSPQYTQGQKSVDSYLLGQAPEIASARQKTLGLTNAIGRENQRASSVASQEQANAQKFGKETNTMIGGQLTGIQGALANQATAAGAEDAAARQRFESGQRTAQDYATLGIDPGTHNFGVSLIDPRWYSAAGAPTASQVANDTQRAQIGALAKLSGQDVGQFYQGYDPNATRQSPYNFQAPQFQTAVSSARDQVQQDVLNSPSGSSFGPTIASAIENLQMRDQQAINDMNSPGLTRNTPAGVAAVQAADKAEYDKLVALANQLYNKKFGAARELGGGTSDLPGNFLPMLNGTVRT